MKTQRGAKNEFNHLYNNLTELCRRVYADENYPRSVCALMFVKELKQLIGDEQVSDLLTETTIIHILEMCKNLLRTEYIDTTTKSELRESAQKLKTMRTNLIEVSTESL